MSFDAESFKVAMAAKGKPVTVVNPEIRAEKQALHADLELFCHDIVRGYSDVARKIEGTKRMALFLAVYFYALGAKDCQNGVKKRFDNEEYLGGYEYQESMVESFIMDYECTA